MSASWGRGTVATWVAQAVLVVALGGCASSGSLSKVVGGAPLPKELEEKFEIKDVSALEAQAAAENPPIEGGTFEPAKAAKATEKKISLKEKKLKGKKGVVPTSLTPSTSASISTGPGQGFSYPSRRPKKDPIWLGERQVFQITYFGMAAGDFTLDVLPHKVVNQRKVYHVRGTAVSSKVFSLFYRLNDSLETFFDFDGLFSHRFHLVLDETKQTRDALELNDSEKGETYYWNRWHHKDKGPIETKEYKPMTPFSQDSLSALYYIRTLPLADGSVTTFPVVSEGKTWEAVVTVVRREMVNSPMGKIRAIVVKPETKYQGVLQKKGDSFIWLSDDDRRFVIKLEAKVKIGTVVATLKKVERGTPPQQ